MRVALRLAVAILLLAMITTPAAAATPPPTADLALAFGGSGTHLMTINPQSGLFNGDTGIGYITETVIRHNYGPNTTPDAMAIDDITAPVGTVFRHLDEVYFAKYPGLCTVVVRHTRVRCKIDGQIPLDTYNGGSGGRGFLFYFIIKKTCVSPGRWRIEYPGDPNISNNSVSLHVKIPGVPASECTKPTPSHTPTAAPSPTVTTAATSASPTSSPPASVEPSATPTFLSPALAAQDPTGGGTTVVIELALGLAGLVAVAAGVLVGLAQRQRRRLPPGNPDPTT
jgi:hypothetical protein